MAGLRNECVHFFVSTNFYNACLQHFEGVMHEILIEKRMLYVRRVDKFRMSLLGLLQ
jgi:hypothetical protein